MRFRNFFSLFVLIVMLGAAGAHANDVAATAGTDMPRRDRPVQSMRLQITLR